MNQCVGRRTTIGFEAMVTALRQHQHFGILIMKGGNHTLITDDPIMCPQEIVTKGREEVLHPGGILFEEAFPGRVQLCYI